MATEEQVWWCIRTFSCSFAFTYMVFAPVVISQLVFCYNKLHACVGAGHEGGMADKELSTLSGVYRCNVYHDFDLTGSSLNCRPKDTLSYKPHPCTCIKMK